MQHNKDTVTVKTQIVVKVAKTKDFTWLCLFSQPYELMGQGNALGLVCKFPVVKNVAVKETRSRLDWNSARHNGLKALDLVPLLKNPT